MVNTEQLVNYWVDASDEKWDTATVLMASKRYADALFFCHLTLEALLKAMVVQHTTDYPPHQHDLVELALRGGITLDEAQTKELSEITTFNIRARYDDYKLSFYKKATPEYAKVYFAATNLLRTWLRNQLQQK